MTPFRLPRPAWSPRAAATAVATVLTGALIALLAPLAPAQAVKVTPGNFTGYGFDQCLAPTQSAMDAWLRSSPFWAVGIYVSGDSRACRSQPNLTPEWVKTQRANGWRLLPITLGPQASCNPRFPRYSDDTTINPRSAHTYRAARAQGRTEATDAVAAAAALGISKRSTLWYDLEAYDIGQTACRESAMYFLSAWTKRLHRLGYVSGVYSSAASGIKALDDARVTRPNTFTLPDQIWIARWDLEANTSTSYLRSDGWLPGGRMKQYQGGHNETWGNVTINIDRNWLDLGKGSVAGSEPEHCGGVRLSWKRYRVARTGDTGNRVTALQCLLTTRGTYSGALDGVMGEATADAVAAFRSSVGLRPARVAGSRVWTALHAAGSTRTIKYGAAGERVRRLQRALNAAGEKIAVTGVFAADTTVAVRRYQDRNRISVSGVVGDQMWGMLLTGKV